MKEIFCTVFTPTYNRAYILNKLYESLLSQTIKDFEWVIVDDGSSDNTKELVNEWKKIENGFNIIYKFQKNGGKHRAINSGIDIARGKMFFIVDSDDYITDFAIEKIKYYESTIKDSKYKFAGVSGYKGYNKNDFIGKSINKEYIDALNTQREKYGLLGDKAEAYYTEILKNNKFPEIEGEKFMTESVVWNSIAGQGYMIRWFNELICICNYIDDGLTRQGNNLLINNPKGYLLSIKTDIKYVKPNYTRKLALYYSYYNIKKAGNNFDINRVCNDLNIFKIELIIAIVLKNIKELLKVKKK